MKTSVIFFIVVIAFWSCKHKPETQKPRTEVIVKEEKAIPKVPVVLIKLGEFANVKLSDVSLVNEFMVFKQIDTNNTVTTIDMNKAVALYRKMTQREHLVSLPIFEIRNTDNAILIIQGVGFGGPIWAKVLVDRTSLEIKKVEFEHKAESEGYGAAMTQSYFEEKFVGAKIDLEKNTFILQRNKERRMDDGTIIDGISGATMTSQAALEMVNLELKNYKGYLRP
jgi:Na+-transporting NADH:ubiquinone oxidoreductase subunit C